MHQYICFMFLYFPINNFISDQSSKSELTIKKFSLTIETKHQTNINIIMHFIMLQIHRIYHHVLFKNELTTNNNNNNLLIFQQIIYHLKYI